MSDGILGQIDELIAEERALRSHVVGRGLTETEQARLRDLEQQLDQCWDLLRQRRASAEFGDREATEEPTPRPRHQVESYEQ
jgi:hypothetical protein